MNVGWKTAELLWSGEGFEVWLGTRKQVLAVAAARGLKPRVEHRWKQPPLEDRRWIDFDDGASFACTRCLRRGCTKEDYLAGKGNEWSVAPKDWQPTWKGYRLTLAPPGFMRPSPPEAHP